MKVIEGHLTAGDKKAVKAIIKMGIVYGKVGRASYQIIEGDGKGTYKIEKFIKDRGLIPVPGSPLRVSKYVSKIII